MAIADFKDPTARFFAYARERHQVYLNRRNKLPRPEWTSDPILRQYRFTNVFRELDKTTVWFREHVRDKLRDEPTVLLATVVFRMLNRIQTGEAVFCQTSFAEKGVGTSTAFDYFLHYRRVNLLKRAITTYCGRGPYVTGAYIISTPPGLTKLDGVMSIIEQFMEGSFTVPSADNFGAGALAWNWSEFADVLLNNRGSIKLQDAFDWFRQHPYLGTFHSYEIVTDLRHTELLSEAPDIMTWANVGPGARRGLNRVHERGRDAGGRGQWGARIGKDEAQEEMRRLLKLSRDAQFWPQAHKRAAASAKRAGDWPRWEIRDVEHTLCEFDKYERVRLGEGVPRGVFR